jgi:hypothetical protein
MRSVQIMALAAARKDTALRKLVAADAKFTLGHVDVAWTVDGWEAVHQFADDIDAASYAYDANRYLTPAMRDPCSPQDVEVEFISADDIHSTKVKFHYEGGLLRSAEGWTVDREVGPVRVETH